MEEQENNQNQEIPPIPPMRETAAEVSQDVRNIAMLCHLLGLLSVIGPLIVWLLEKDKHEYIDYHGKQAINFQVSLIIYSLAACATIILIPIALPIIAILNIIFVIIASLKAGEGVRYKYPIAIPFLK